MELITLIILIIVCGLGILLAFRLITFILRIVSIVILLIAIICVAGSYFSAQAYVLPVANTAYITLTVDGGFVIDQIDAKPYTFDSVATAALSRQFIKPINEFNSDAYTKLKSFARSDIFASSDTVWVVNAINKSGCNQDRIIKDPKLFVAFCLEKSDSKLTSTINVTNSPTVKDTLDKVRLVDQVKSLFDVSVLNRVPVKSDFLQWLKNYFLA